MCRLVRHMSLAFKTSGAAFLLFLGTSLMHAQTSFDLNVGFGTAHASANSGGIDNANCQSLPELKGVFLGLGGDLMLYKHFGVGFEANLQPVRQSYGPLDSRESFYDVNGIYAPINTKRASLRLEGGIGGARTSFSLSQSGCVGTAVCTTSNEPVGAANHFQAHVGVGVQIYLTEHIFIRPQFDYHYVPGLTDQFGSNSVPAGMVWVGYSFGER